MQKPITPTAPVQSGWLASQATAAALSLSYAAMLFVI